MSMHLDGMWTISRYMDHFGEYEYFGTKEEAIAFGKQYEEFSGRDFYVGKIEGISIRAGCLAEHILDIIIDAHDSEDGEDGSEFLCNVDRAHVEELDGILETAIQGWAEKHGYKPSRFGVKQIEKVDNREE